MEFLLDGVLSVTWQQLLIYGVEILLIWLVMKEEYEPVLLLLIGFGAVLVDLPLTGVINQTLLGVEGVNGIIERLFDVEVEASGALPILLFIGVRAMIDSGPLPSQPAVSLFGAVAQFGIFFAICAMTLMGFDLTDAALIGIIGAADGPTSILVSQMLYSECMGAIAVAAYSYMTLVSIIQPFAIRLVTTEEERQISTEYKSGNVSKSMKIAFPIVVTMIVGMITPMSVTLINLLISGNLLRECGVLENLPDIAQHTLANLIILLLGITISFSMRASIFIEMGTLMIMTIGLLVLAFDTIGGVLFAKFLNLSLKVGMNPMIGIVDIPVFPMPARVVQKMVQKEKPGNITSMHAIGANVSGQVASVVAGGLIISLANGFL